MMDEYIKQISEELDFSKNSINDFGNGIILTNNEIEVLDKYKIDYKNCTSLKNLITKIEIIIEECEYQEVEDLDYISESISERDYYKNTNK